jgi:hypothetical protein
MNLILNVLKTKLPSEERKTKIKRLIEDKIMPETKDNGGLYFNPDDILKLLSEVNEFSPKMLVSCPPTNDGVNVEAYLNNEPLPQFNLEINKNMSETREISVETYARMFDQSISNRHSKDFDQDDKQKSLYNHSRFEVAKRRKKNKSKKTHRR